MGSKSVAFDQESKTEGLWLTEHNFKEPLGDE